MNLNQKDNSINALETCIRLISDEQKLLESRIVDLQKRVIICAQTLNKLSDIHESIKENLK
jgi:hypothetical protein